MNTIQEAMEANRQEMPEWFEHMHCNPELSMKEQKTARYIADLVKQWGYEVETEVGKHGVVASMTVGDGDKAIGLRADFDALRMQEDNSFPYKSRLDGVSHLSGLDGHSTLLLAAVKYLIEPKNFNVAVGLLFLPAEATIGGCTD